MSNSNTKVVITGMGVVSPIGNSCSKFLKSLQLGKNGISYISSFDTNKFSVKIAGEVKIDLDDLIDKKEQNRIDRFTALTIFASYEAINNSNLLNTKINKERVGVIIGGRWLPVSEIDLRLENIVRFYGNE